MQQTVDEVPLRKNMGCEAEMGSNGRTSRIHDRSDHPVEAVLHLPSFVHHSAVQRNDPCSVHIADLGSLLRVGRVQSLIAFAGEDDDWRFGSSSPEGLQ